MAVVETVLTPELATQLLAKPYVKQRRRAKGTVAEYARRIKEGLWRLVYDPVMVTAEGEMFNGGHRCEAVVMAHRSIPIYIDWAADPSLFDVIDVGRYRSPFQFVDGKEATVRTSASRLTLWYDHRFERPPYGSNLVFDNQEILGEVERRSTAFDAALAPSRELWDLTSIARSVSTAAFALAEEMGYHDEIASFMEAVREPGLQPANNPARLLAERFRHQAHRARRRQQVDDWTVLVYAFNLHLEGKPIEKLYVSRIWPRVAEASIAYRRRQNTLVSRTTPRRRRPAAA
jgi:hypothetical protein